MYHLKKKSPEFISFSTLHQPKLLSLLTYESPVAFSASPCLPSPPQSALHTAAGVLSSEPFMASHCPEQNLRPQQPCEAVHRLAFVSLAHSASSSKAEPVLS